MWTHTFRDWRTGTVGCALVLCVCVLLCCGVPRVEAMGWLGRQRVEFRNNVRMREATVAIQASDYRGARQLLVGILESEPGNMTAERMLVQVECWLEAWDLALARCCRILEVAPGDVEMRMSKAFLAARTGRYRVAADELRWVLSETRDKQRQDAARQMMGRVALELARMASESGHPTEALRHYETYLTSGGPLTEYVGGALLDTCLALGLTEMVEGLVPRLRAIPDVSPAFLERVDVAMLQLRRAAKN